MKQNIINIVIGIVFLAIVNVAESKVDGFYLLETCESALESINNPANIKENDKFAVGYCSGLVQGIQYSIMVNGTVSTNSVNENKKNKITLCFEKEYNSIDYIEGVIKYIKRKPEVLSGVQQSIIEEAIIDMYKCDR